MLSWKIIFFLKNVSGNFEMIKGLYIRLNVISLVTASVVGLLLSLVGLLMDCC